MYDYQIAATVAQTRSQDLLAQAEAHRLAKAVRTTSIRRSRTWAWLDHRPAVRALTAAR